MTDLEFYCNHSSLLLKVEPDNQNCTFKMKYVIETVINNQIVKLDYETEKLIFKKIIDCIHKQN